MNPLCLLSLVLTGQAELGLDRAGPHLEHRKWRAQQSTGGCDGAVVHLMVLCQKQNLN